jgi:hypothetical protein
VEEARRDPELPERPGVERDAGPAAEGPRTGADVDGDVEDLADDGPDELPCGCRCCAWSPRRTPRCEREWLSWTKGPAMPAAANLCSWYVSRKNPRSSRCTIGSRMRTPGRSVGITRTGDGYG